MFEALQEVVALGANNELGTIDPDGFVTPRSVDRFPHKAVENVSPEDE